MTIAYKGSLSIGDLCPLVVSAHAATFAELNAKLAGLLELQAKLTITPPSIAGSITIVANLLAGLQAAVTLGLPGVDFQLAAVAAAMVSINASLSILLSLQVTFGAAGVFVYSYEGAVGAFGGELNAALAAGFPGAGGPLQGCNALVLGTVTPATWTAMAAFFGGAG